MTLDNPHLQTINERFLRAVETDKIHLRVGLKMEDLARELATNRTYVAQLFKVAYNSTFSAYINHLRIEHAKALLAQHNQLPTLYELAHQCGFGTVSTFNMVFKNETGYTPLNWHKRLEH